MVRLETDRVIAPDAATRRRFARAVLGAAEPFPLLAFRAADTHAHLLVRGSRDDAGEMTRRVSIAAYHAVGGEDHFRGAWFKPVHDQHHLANTFFYVLRQADRHGIDADPGHEASNLPDLIGLRPLGVWTAQNVRSHLPRVTRRDLLGVFGMPDLPREPTAAEASPFVRHVLEAACAAVALPTLAGRAAEVVDARRAALQATDRPTAELAAHLGLRLRAAQRLRTEAVGTALLHAVRGQLIARGRGPAPTLAYDAAVTSSRA